MKKNQLFRFLMPVVALFVLALPLSSCTDDGDDDKKPNGPVVTEFELSIDELTYESITFTVTPPTSTPVFFVRLYSDSSDLDYSDEELASAIINGEGFREFTFLGPQTLTFQGLIGHSHYRLIYFAYDEVSKTMLSDFFRSERITTPDAPEYFTIETENITGLGADITVTPPNDTMTYYYYLEEVADYEERMDSSDNMLIQTDFKYWQFMASMYDDVDWLDLLRAELISGVRQDHTDALFASLMWDTEYVVYAYGVDQMGNITHQMTKKTFKTEAPTPSDNTFEVVVDENHVWSKEKNGFISKATVTPKNTDESYYAVITNKDWYDWFFGEYNEGRSDDAYIMYQLILSNPSSTIALSECKVGESVISNEDWMTGLRPNRDYAVFVFGFGENGATTGLTVVPFTTPSRPVEE